MKKIRFTGEKKFVSALEELGKEYGFVLSDDGVPFSCKRGGDGISIDVTPDSVALRYGDDDSFFRAFSLALEFTGSTRHIEVKSDFRRMGIMLNCSNKPLNVPFIKNFIRKCALMGYNYLELYTEVTYEIPSEPYFGYMKGRYSQAELKEIVSYGKKFGVELVPCIQTLGHMQDLFKWVEYSDVHDIEKVMLIDCAGTYALIEKMLASLSECFDTDRINLGMDESYFAGFGRYNWFIDPNKPDLSQLFVKHLKRVLALAEKYGFTQPAIWFDNLFGINYKGYINPPVWLFDDFKKEIRESFPNVQMIFWNYVITDEHDFSRFVGYIRQLSDNISFASMAHGYTSFAPDGAQTAKLVNTAKNACKANGIDDIMITWWGSMLSPLALAGSLCDYIERCSDSCGYDADERCKFLFGYTYKELLELDLPNKLEDNAESTGMAEGKNPAFYILANDLLLDIMSAHIPCDAAQKYEKYAVRLKELSTRGGEISEIFAFESELCELLAMKCGLPEAIKDAYDRRDKKAIVAIAKSLPTLAEKTRKFHDVYRKYWYSFNKSFGWEVFDNRLGGAVMRIETVKSLLEDFADGKISVIEELECSRLPVNKALDGKTAAMGSWNYCATTEQ